MSKAKGVPCPGRRKNPPQVIDKSKIPPEVIKSTVAECSQYFNQPICKTDEEVCERLTDFFHHCVSTGELPTVEKMCLSLGAARSTVTDWANWTKGSVMASIIKSAKEVMAAIDAELALKGYIKEVPYIFRAKNYYDLKDQQDVVVQAKNIFGADTSREEIERRLTEEVVIEATTEEPPAETPPTIEQDKTE